MLGLVTIDDILEEIVGDYTTNFTEQVADIIPHGDDEFLIMGSATLRDINKQLAWELPTQGAKTLNGLLLEQLESFPDANGVSLSLKEYHFEVLAIQDNMISRVKSKRIASNVESEFDEDVNRVDNI